MSDQTTPFDPGQLLGVAEGASPGVWIGIRTPPLVNPAPAGQPDVPDAAAAQPLPASSSPPQVAGGPARSSPDRRLSSSEPLPPVSRRAPSVGRRPVDPEKIPPYLRDLPVFRWG
jgi:hypothetical protein